MLGGLRNKAACGELRIQLPAGLVWGEEPGQNLLHPDEAVRGAIAAVFARFAVNGSARQAWLPCPLGGPARSPHPRAASRFTNAADATAARPIMCCHLYHTRPIPGQGLAAVVPVWLPPCTAQEVCARSAERGRTKAVAVLVGFGCGASFGLPVPGRSLFGHRSVWPAAQWVASGLLWFCRSLVLARARGALLRWSFGFWGIWKSGPGPGGWR